MRAVLNIASGKIRDSGVKDQRGFPEPEQVEAGVAIATPDGNKEQEHGPIVKTKIGTTDILRGTIWAGHGRFWSRGCGFSSIVTRSSGI